MPEKIAILGAGNVATQLVHAFAKAEKPVSYLIVRDRNKGLCIADSYSKKTVIIEGVDLQYYDFSFLIICVSDRSLSDVVNKVQLPLECLVVHTSGSSNLHIFNKKFVSYGVFYPLQTFSKGRTIDMVDVPIFIEGVNEDVTKRAISVGKIISKEVSVLNSSQRADLHLSGVLVNNFTNHLITKAKEFLSNANLEYHLLLPLLKETVEKLYELPPEEGQTGPAFRGDQEILEKHLSRLEKHPELREIYKAISKSIKAANH